MADIQYGLIAPEAMQSLSGLAFFQKVMAGELPHPPVAQMFDMVVTSVESGMMTWEGQVPESMLNPMGGVHGGFALTVLDSALGCAAHSALPAGRAYTTIDVKANLTRAVPLGERLTCEGRVVTMGRRVATAEAKLLDARGRILAFGTSSLLVFDVA